MANGKKDFSSEGSKMYLFRNCPGSRDCWGRMAFFIACVILSQREKHVLKGEKERGNFIVCERK